ncbi:hypothetical protein DSO57_1018746 [Entomophthora muscae]|uniref:Uncharacterized protein n=1 Tax=Entomophthora muscae TaxID=34485 RepID=A0ACC2RV92_9FUNG|nr:hypothetical protein DSO57_1018746 [Entomophthora muscae]
MFNQLGRRLKDLDAFPKIAEEYTQKTNLGGMITALVSLFLGFLIQSEFRSYREIKQSYEFLVESSPSDTPMQINVDMYIAMPCGFLNVDVLDVTGQSLSVKKQIKLIPSHFDAGKAHELRTHAQSTEKISSLISKAEEGETKLDLTEGTLKDACRAVGSFKVKKVAGNFHITALGHGHGGEHVPHESLNFTHRIDRLSFGENYPKLINPLDDSIGKVQTNFDSFKYYISVVPTIYIDNSERILITNQYAVTNHQTTPVLGVMTELPGIFFEYDIEALMVRVTEQRQSFSTFLVRMCGIIGGVWASMGILHNILTYLAKIRRSKGRSHQK